MKRNFPLTNEKQLRSAVDKMCVLNTLIEEIRDRKRERRIKGGT